MGRVLIRSRHAVGCRSVRGALAAVLLVAMPLASCAREPARGLTDLSRVSFRCFDVARDGDRLHLLFAAGPADAPGLWHAVSRDGGASWSTPSAVAVGDATPHHAKPGKGPQIAAAGDKVVAVWTTGGTGFMGRGPLASATSTDGGRTWRPHPCPAPLDDASGQAFIDLVTDANGRIHAVWLDKRSIADGARKALQHAWTDDGGATWATPLTIDTSTCECCWNRAAVGRDGEVLVVYRDLAPRDMAVARGSAAGWRSLGRAGAFDWGTTACPHIGGGIATGDDGRVHTVVWTDKIGVRGVHYTAGDGNGAWSEPMRLGGEGARHPDVALGAGGVLAATWDEPGTGVLAARSTDGGRTWSEPVGIARSDKAHHPRVVPAGDSFRILWIEERPSRTVIGDASFPVNS